MAKAGIEFQSASNFIRDKTSHCGWALCLGAGTSLPLFPSWGSLVESLVEKDVGTQRASAVSHELCEQFSYDALIQAAQEKLGYNDQDFVVALSDALYAHARHILSPHEFATLIAVLQARQPNHATLKQWRDFLALLRTRFPTMSALALGELVADIATTAFRPAAILSFNAEPLLYAIVNAIYATTRVPPDAAARNQMAAKLPLDMVLGATSYRIPERIPYYFCHGLLPVPGCRTRALAGHRLVFSEAEYLHIASTSFSWQASAFLDAALFRSVVFVGVSLSDPNMRRWLSWVHRTRCEEIAKISGQSSVVSTGHYWLKVRNQSDEVNRWIEASVAHLGVRLVWLDSWEQTGPVLKRALGLA